jgi:hypothetical protein
MFSLPLPLHGKALQRFLDQAQNLAPHVQDHAAVVRHEADLARIIHGTARKGWRELEPAA